MSAISQELVFQAFVHLAGREWIARPVLADLPWGRGENPAVAVDDLERVLRRRFEKVGPGDLGEVLWLSWQPPDLATPRLVLQVGFGKRTLECTLVVATFVSGAQRFVSVPRLGHWFVLYAERRDWQVALQEQLDAHLRARRADDEEWEPPAEAELRRDRVLPGRLSLRSELRPFQIGVPSVELRRATLEGDDADRSATEELRALAEDLTDRRDLRRALVPHRIVDVVVETMTTRAAPLALVGPSGSGRSTLVHEAVHRMREDAAARERQALLDALNRQRKPVPEPPIRRVYHLDPQRIVTGMSVVGQWQRRLERVFEWVRDRRRATENQDGSDVIFVDDPVVLARVGRSAGSDMVASGVFRSWLDLDAFPMIVEATPEQWHRLTELDRPFAELFRVVRVDPPDAATLLAIAVRHRARLEEAHGIALQPGAIQRALEIEVRHGGTRGLPGGLVDRLEQVASATPTGTSASAETVDEVFQASSGLSPEIASPRYPLDDATLRATLSSRLVGQPAAVDALASAVHALKSGLRPRNRPVCCWLFVGPTGVGKTEAAKVLVQTLFTTPDRLVRFDMNAFADGGAVHRLIGDLESGDGLLTGAVRRRPFAVLLLDEIEKAHPSVHDLLLQVLDEGRLTDALGRTTSFESCLVVMTSNVGAAETGRATGFERGAEAMEQSYRSAVGRAFRPEFVNRLDRIVAFASLGPAELRVVADLQLHRLLSRDGFRNRTVLLDVPDDALDRIAREAWDPRFGARGLKRAIERRLAGAAASVLAAIPMDQPVRLVVVPTGDALDLRIEPLHWAKAVDPEPPSDEDPGARIAGIEAILEPFRPRGPIATADAAEVLALLERLGEIRAALDDQDPVEELPEGASAAILQATRFARVKPKHDWAGRNRVELGPERLRAGLRSLLVELARVQPERSVERSELELALVLVRANALVGGKSGGARVQVRPAARATPTCTVASRWVQAGLGQVILALGGQPVTFEDGQPVDVHGVGMFELLSREAGLHWWLPAAEAPTVVEVQVDPLGPDVEDRPAVRQDTILRVICRPATRYDGGAVHDLRTGEVVRYAEGVGSVVRWVLAAMAAR